MRRISSGAVIARVRPRPRGAPAPLIAAAAWLAALGIAFVLECYEEVPRVPYELAEYAGVSVRDLGTSGLFDEPATLKISFPARRSGRVRFLVAGDGGQDEDPGKRALARVMRELCRRSPCDFVLFTGDNVYYNGIDTFSASALADSIAGLELRERFLSGLSPTAAAAVGARVRAAAGRVAAACGGLRADSAAARAYERHFAPKFERTFGWLAEDGIPAFVVLGNHDWRSLFGPECEIGYSLSGRSAWRMPFYFYQVEVTDPAGGRPLADMFVLYSAPPHAATEGDNYARIGPRQAEWLTSALAASSARWKLAASHHPVWSAGAHTLLEYRSFHRDLLTAVARAGIGLDLLLAGHNHWLESAVVELRGRPALQVVSGSLSKVSLLRMFARGYPLFNAVALSPAWRTRLARDLHTDPDAFLREGRSVLTRGFALVELEGERATVRFFQGGGGELYHEVLRRRGARDGRPTPTEASVRRSTPLIGKAGTSTSFTQ